MHIYAFGSTCRGEVTVDSDVDLLAITQGHDERFDATTYSIYSYNRIREIWLAGNPFAWHLHLEAKLIHTDDRIDFLKNLGPPKKYGQGREDCLRFKLLFNSAQSALARGTNSQIFELSTIFLSVRNFATCYSLANGEKPDFSRSSALSLGTDSLPIDTSVYATLERARILCTRGQGTRISMEDTEAAIQAMPLIRRWMTRLLSEIPYYA